MNPAPDHDVEVLAISGAAGVGKTTVAIEASVQLKRAGVAHAFVDTDALDDLYPVPSEQWRLSERNLAAVWAGFREHRATRLILTGVYLDRPEELAWVSRAVPGSRLTVVRLIASVTTLEARIAARELGSGRDAQLERTHRQLERLAEVGTGPSVRLVETDGRSVTAVAGEILGLTGWLGSGGAA